MCSWHLATRLLTITDKSHASGSVKSQEEVVVSGAVLRIKMRIKDIYKVTLSWFGALKLCV